MITQEQLVGILDIIKGILGVKSQSAEIMLRCNGEIVFRTSRSMIYEVHTDLFCLPYDIFIEYNENLTYLDPVRSNSMMQSYSYCVNHGPLLMYAKDLDSDPEFVELTTLKSKDGIGYYTIYDQYHNMYKIPMFTGFVKFNKGDKSDIEIYDAGYYYLNKFIVKKKKINYPIQVYFLTLKLT